MRRRALLKGAALAAWMASSGWATRAAAGDDANLTAQIDAELGNEDILETMLAPNEDLWLKTYLGSPSHGMFGTRIEKFGIPSQALTLIIAQEVGGPAYFKKHRLQHLIYPGRSSGPTIGMGYDIGQLSNDARGRKNLEDDWEGLLSAEVLDKLGKGLGLTRQDAKHFADANSDIVVDYQLAERQLTERMIPYLLGSVFEALNDKPRALPNACIGALCSLCYNRGVTFRKPGAKHQQMRNIAFALARDKPEAVPGELWNMRELWPAGSGLYKRREIEAKMFQAGLLRAGLPTQPFPLS